MRLALWSSETSPSPGAGDAIAVPPPNIDPAEFALARELDKVLAKRETTHDPNRTTGSSTRTAVTRDQILAHLPQGNAAIASAPVAVQRFQARFDAGGDAPAFLSADTSLRWIEKSKAERRRRAFKNALGWVTTLTAGGVIVAVSAFLLTGWTPDWAQLSARASDIGTSVTTLWR